MIMLVYLIDGIDSSHGDGLSVVLDAEKGQHMEAAAECGYHYLECFIGKSTLLRHLEV